MSRDATPPQGHPAVTPRQPAPADPSQAGPPQPREESAAAELTGPAESSSWPRPSREPPEPAGPDARPPATSQARTPAPAQPWEPPANGRLRVWCLRHAESENTVLGAVGALPHTPLTPTGRRQAVEAGQRLRNEPVARVYTSPALRARETAQTVAAQFGRPTVPGVVPLPGLAEVSLGSREGATNQATRSRLDQVLHAWLVAGDREPRVADGESGHQVVSRVTTALHQITVYHPPGACVVLVGHAVSLTAGLVDRCGLDAEVWSRPLPHAEPFTVEWDGRAWHCPAWPAPN